MATLPRYEAATNWVQVRKIGIPHGCMGTGLLAVSIVMLALVSGCLSSDSEGSNEIGGEGWVDPVTEIEDANHSHSDLWRTGYPPRMPS